jgi:hypothetical protein
MRIFCGHRGGGLILGNAEMRFGMKIAGVLWRFYCGSWQTSGEIWRILEEIIAEIKEFSSYFVDNLGNDCYFVLLFAETCWKHHLTRIITSQISSLFQGLIPVFAVIQLT